MIPEEDRATAEPIAVVGLSCRLPGGVTSPSNFWDFLAEGRSGQGKAPRSRFNLDAFCDEDSTKSGTINKTGGYFLQEDVRLFDNAFFGINNLEAKYTDPQQHQLLEDVYECLESSGVSLQDVSGSNVGCYVANFTTDFMTMQAKNPVEYHTYSATAFEPTIRANRISHVFNLLSPSVVLDTACSSSLYVLRTACAALNAGECDAAIVAGANLVQSPETYIAMTKAGVLSGTATCHTFDSTIRVACINSPRSTTARGEPDSIEVLLQTLQGRGVFASKLKTDGKAYHSHLMAPAGQEYKDLLALVFSKRAFAKEEFE